MVLFPPPEGGYLNPDNFSTWYDMGWRDARDALLPRNENHFRILYDNDPVFHAIFDMGRNYDPNAVYVTEAEVMAAKFLVEHGDIDPALLKIANADVQGTEPTE